LADGEQRDEVLDDDEEEDEGVEEADEEGNDEDALGVAEIGASDEAANSNPIVSASAAEGAHLPCS
jgi:hypothetical protein